MTTYILLRSNKESGPYSIEQLRELGIKPNDLIWVEGQSASWRNPHEIPQLKDLTGQPPVVNTETTDSHQEEKSVSSPKPETSTCRKSSVFVAFPEKTAAKTTGGGQVNSAKQETIQPAKSIDIRFDEIKQEKSKEEVETKYAMSLDEIKQRYIKSLESRKNKISSFRFRIPKEITRAAVYIGLVGLGAMIVLLVMKTNRPLSPIAGEQKRIPANFENRPETETNAISPVDQDVILPESYYDSQNSMETNRANQSTVKKNTRVSEQENDNGEDPVSVNENDTVEEDPTDHKISIPKNETPEIRSVTAGDIADQIFIKTNRYTIAALGGIKDLELTIRNDSRYTLDKVTVEVRFLNPNGNIVKTEDVHFKSIQPSGSQTIGMKKTNRGVKVSHRIIRIESKEIGTHTAGL